jgi:flagellin
MRINFDPNSAFAIRNLSNTQLLMSKSMSRLSSGLRVSRPSDDAAAFSMASRMKSTISSTQVAQTNVSMARGMVDTASSAIDESLSIMQRVRELAVQWNATTNTTDRANMQAEVVQLNAELVRIHGQTTFNGMNVAGGGAATTATVQVGANTTDTLAIVNPQLQTVLGTTVSGFSTQSTATAANIANIDTVINTMTARAATMGAQATRLESIERSNAAYIDNLSQAHSNLVDVDFAREMANHASLQIKQQAGMAMLAQANQNRQNLFSMLFGG